MNIAYDFLLGTVVCALLLRRGDVTLMALSAAIALALHSNVIDVLGVSSLAVLACSAYFSFHNKKYQALALPIMIGLIAGILFHKIPGFHNTLALDEVRFSKASAQYSMYLNFDKVAAGLIIFAIGGLAAAEKLPNFKSILDTIAILILAILVIMIPARCSGHVLIDAKIPEHFWIWSLNNFFFVSFAEEVIFRGFIQRKLTADLKLDPFFAIAISSIIFGLAHFKGGVTYITLSAVCGVFYGFAYYKTNRILCAMLVHFGLNLTHFLFFTYPFAK